VEQYVVAASAAQIAAADAEAIRYLDRALELVMAFPDGAARDVSELTVRVVRGRSHVSMQGYSAPGAADDYRRSLELSERVGTGVDVVPATTAVWAYYLVHGDLRAAAEALSRLEETSGPEFDAEISCCAGVQRFFEGRITEARARLEASVAAFSARRIAGVATSCSSRAIASSYFPSSMSTRGSPLDASTNDGSSASTRRSAESAEAIRSCWKSSSPPTVLTTSDAGSNCRARSISRSASAYRPA